MTKDQKVSLVPVEQSAKLEVYLSRALLELTLTIPPRAQIDKLNSLTASELKSKFCSIEKCL